MRVYTPEQPACSPDLNSGLPEYKAKSANYSAVTFRIIIIIIGLVHRVWSKLVKLFRSCHMRTVARIESNWSISKRVIY
jgi:hypothetical protein